MIIKRFLYFLYFLSNNTGIKIPGRTFWAPIFQVKHLAIQPANQGAQPVIERDHAHSPFSNREANETELIRKHPNTAFGVAELPPRGLFGYKCFWWWIFCQSHIFSVGERVCRFQARFLYRDYDTFDSREQLWLSRYQPNLTYCILLNISNQCVLLKK